MVTFRRIAKFPDRAYLRRHTINSLRLNVSQYAQRPDPQNTRHAQDRRQPTSSSRRPCRRGDTQTATPSNQPLNRIQALGACSNAHLRNFARAMLTSLICPRIPNVANRLRNFQRRPAFRTFDKPPGPSFIGNDMLPTRQPRTFEPDLHTRMPPQSAAFTPSLPSRPPRAHPVSASSSAS